MPLLPPPGPSPPRPRSAGPVLTSAWTRVEELPPRREASTGTVHPDPDDGEWDEQDEVDYVVLDFAHHLADDALSLSDGVQLLAPESATPIARIGHKYFQGLHETLIGNEILLQHDPEGLPSYQPFATPSHRISFQPVSIALAPLPAYFDPGENGQAGPYGGRSGRGGGTPGAEEAARTEAGAPPKRKPGRPKGSEPRPYPAAPPSDGGGSSEYDLPPRPALGDEGNEQAGEADRDAGWPAPGQPEDRMQED
ncbi:hypothetical protein JCM1841_002687 [Sporobolomyces salmonicolor]